MEAATPRPEDSPEGETPPLLRTEGSRFWLFLALATAFYLPVLAGRTFQAGDFLFLTPPWYDPSRTLQNFDLFDAILQYHPANLLLGEALRRGSLALWDPYSFAGYPLYADGLTGFLYPPRLLLLFLLPTALAHDVLLWLHTFLAGWLMDRWLRRAGTTAWGGLLGGVAWMFNPYTLCWSPLEFSVVTTGLVPLVLLSVESARRGWRGVPGGALALALLMICGNIQFSLYALGMVTVASFLRARADRHPGQFPRGAVLVVGALLLAAPQLLPGLELLRAAQRPVITPEYQMSVYRQAAAGFPATLLTPEALGSPATHFAVRRTLSGYFIFPELVVYFGVVPLALAGLGACQRGLPRALAGLALGAALLPATPLWLLLARLPLVSQLIPTRLGYFLGFCGVVAAAFGMGRLPQRGRTLAGVALLALVGLAFYAWTLESGAAQRLEALLQSPEMVRLPDRAPFPSDGEWSRAVREGGQRTWNMAGWALGWPLFLVAGLALAAWRRSPRALVLLTVLDLACFGLRQTPQVPRDWIYPPNPTATWLSAHAGSHRVMGLGTYRPRSFEPYRLRDVAGYDSLYPRTVAEYLHVMEHGDLPEEVRFGPQAFPLTRPDSPLVDLMAVRYLVAYPDAHVPGWRLVARTPLTIWENPEAMDRAFLVPGHHVVANRRDLLRGLDDGRFDARHAVLLEAEPTVAPAGRTFENGEVRFVVDEPERVLLSVSADGAGWLVLADTWWPGWEARVDGARVPVARAYGNFRAIPVGPGRHRVEFVFRPGSWRLGWALAGAGLLLLVGAALQGAGRRASDSGRI